jgi:hypothetical protein
MQSFYRSFSLAGVALCVTAHAAEVDKGTPLQRYQSTVSAGAIACSAERSQAASIAATKKNGSERYDLPEQVEPDWRGCIVKNKAQIKAEYEAALKTVKKLPAKAALKEHLVAAIAQLDGITPTADELKIDYTRRQSANSTILSDKWTRFEIEQ